ncbi:MAG: hypothetical protein LBP92_09075 [Deltaproteobacteria bacterium]|jgi:hypothetical protein|nr:hypothetical protein [Deltaproteobacteria bacterium]
MSLSVLNWKARRSLSESPKATTAALAAAGRELMGHGRPVEAADFLAKGSDSEGLALLRAQAVEEGDFFLYSRICQLQKTAPSEGELQSLADRAASLGLLAYESSARELLARGLDTP